MKGLANGNIPWVRRCFPFSNSILEQLETVILIAGQVRCEGARTHGPSLALRGLQGDSAHCSQQQVHAQVGWAFTSLSQVPTVAFKGRCYEIYWRRFLRNLFYSTFTCFCALLISIFLKFGKIFEITIVEITIPHWCQYYWWNNGCMSFTVPMWAEVIFQIFNWCHWV